MCIGPDTLRKRIVSGKQYYYYVRAVARNGNVSSKSNVVKKYCKLKQPAIKKITNISSSGKIKLTWNKVADAVKYVETGPMLQLPTEANQTSF